MIRDPVSAYDQIAPLYASLSAPRRAYLEAVERIVIGEIPPDSRSLLDIGAADGTRAARIAKAAGLTDLVLLEPSAAMRSRCPKDATVWPIRAEDLPEQQGSFDAITCLWNVLGHIFPAQARAGVLRGSARMLAPQGRIFLDVNHRYNACHYGVLPTAGRFLRDLLSTPGAHGDVTVTWGDCSTTGHVFTHREIDGLVRSAGLAIEKRFVVDYATGGLRRFAFEGHLMYVLTL